VIDDLFVLKLTMFTVQFSRIKWPHLCTVTHTCAVFHNY